MTLDFALTRSIVIRAERETVFSFFTDPARFAAWWGEGSTIEGRKGGRVKIRYPNGDTASGEVLEIEKDRKVVFTFGYDDPGKPIAPGGSRVTVTLEDVPGGTRLELCHEVESEAVRDMHVPGWRHQLALFANAAANAQHAQAEQRVDRWFEAWTEEDPEALRARLSELTTDDVEFRDAFACIAGRDELAQHIAAARMHMPAMKLEREGGVRHCQGTAVADWRAKDPVGEVKAAGTNVFEFALDGKVRRVVGLWRG